MKDKNAQKEKSGKGLKVFSLIVWVVFLIEALAMLFGVWYIDKTLKLLPSKYLMALWGVIAVTCGLHLFCMLMRKGKLGLRIVSLVLSVIVLFVVASGVYYGETFRISISETYDDSVIEAPKVDVGRASFMVYVSGLDQAGTINPANSDREVKGRSDVNILIAVNPNTKKILMVHIPRDYYVPLGNDPQKMDKITHAGNYGVQCSKETVDGIFGLQSNYYLKVNFNSVVEIVDMLGGITVYSDYEFYSQHSLTGEVFNFQKGENYLNGNAALAFSRERYKVSGGDRQRGKHQQQVIGGVLKKAMSSAILWNFAGFFRSVSRNIKTNMSYDDMATLVRMQLEDMASWDIDSISIDGTGTYRHSYMMGKDLYVMIPDETTVETAKQQLLAVMEQ